MGVLFFLTGGHSSLGLATVFFESRSFMHVYSPAES